jgi:ammonium transporter, Amt family
MCRVFADPQETMLKLIAEQARAAHAERLLADAQQQRDALQQQLAHLQQTFDQQIEERTNQLAKMADQLADAAAMSEAANRAKSEFLANISHEIRTPMTAIVGYIDLLNDYLASGVPIRSSSDICSVIRRNASQLLGLIDDILELSMIESSKLVIHREQFDFMPVITGAIERLQPSAEGRGLRIVLETSGPLPVTIDSDPSRVTGIMRILLSNAVKFTPVVRSEGENRDVRVKVWMDGGPQAKLRIAVIDQGIGISAGQMTQLFRPFSQVDSSMSRKHGGNGLGLSIAQRFADLLGGEILVQSTVDKGSKFEVVLPLGPVEQLRMRPGMTAGPAVGVTGAVGVVASAVASGDEPLRCRVLLAEDGPDNQRLISLHLRKGGAEVEVVENGKLAVDRALSAIDCGRPYDLILMDMQMPEMDGYEATRQLRQRGYGRPIVALTAHAMSTDRAKCLDVGCDEYATKPIDRKSLISLVRTWACRGMARAA